MAGTRTYRRVLVGTALVGALVLGAGPAGGDVIDIDGGGSGLSVTANVPVVGPVTVGPLPSVTAPPGGDQTLVGVPANPVADAQVLSAATEFATGPGGFNDSAASVVGTNVLAGVLTAGVITSACAADEAGAAGTSEVLDAQAAGIPLAVTPPVNTTIPLPLVGTLHLNEQTMSGPNQMTVTALRLELNTAGLVTGEVAISRASCGVAAGPTVGGAVGGPGGPGGPATPVTGAPNYTG